MAYDKKFKLRVIKFKDAGHTFAEVYEAFGVYPQRYYIWKKEFVETGTLKTAYPKEHKGKIDKEKLTELVEKHKDWYLSEFAEEFGVWPQSIHKMFVKMGITRKKKLLPTAKSQKKKERHI